jgi:hypothetical protein
MNGKQAGKDYSLQRLILGTHTSEGEQNLLQIAEVPNLQLSLPSIILRSNKSGSYDGIVE